MRGLIKSGIPVLVATFALQLSAVATAAGQPDDHPSAPVAQPADASIVVTINPEGRVSAVLSGDLPRPEHRGAPVALAIKVINQGFATGHLLAVLVGDPPAAATLDFSAERLKGVPLEMRMLRITLTRPAPTDLTIAFRLANEMPDFGGRDQVHLLIRPQ
jgi:hypothetical protein